MTCENYGPFTRGNTLKFKTFFYDEDGEITTPASAVLNLVYVNSSGNLASEQIEMDAPGDPAEPWTAEFDTREVGPGIVFWSIHSLNMSDVIPFAVQDGSFPVNANAANLPTF